MVKKMNWEENFDYNDYDDFKSAEVERERLKEVHSTQSWIYIGVDPERTHESKIGLTSNTLATRATGTQNTRYSLFYAFKAKHDVGEDRLAEIEGAIIAALERQYERLIHRTTRRKSEWFVVDAYEMRDAVYEILCKNYTYDMHAYYCDQREMWIFNSWQNLNLLYGKELPPYYAQDHSNPPIAFECLTPPGCGDRHCRCW